MTYDTYRLIFYGGAIACVVMLIVSVILFITLKIPNVIGDLSGRNARKAIENIRKQNEATGEKGYKSSAVNLERGKLTDKISLSGNIKRQENVDGFGMPTEKISTSKLETTVLNDASAETTVLSQYTAGETTLLNQFMVIEEITFIHTNEFI
mgnify:CR=1 FL=1